MIIVTGGAGFIGSAFVWKLNEEGIDDILIVDELGTSDKWKNLSANRFKDYINKDEFINKLDDSNRYFDAEAIIHMGACSSTTERDADYMMENNYRYTKILAEWSLIKNIRFIYASSAATYGDGRNTFSDDDAVTKKLVPLNIYGYSKHIFDLYVLRNKLTDKITGLKFFNVFGPNEYHKEDMVSVIYKAFGQISSEGRVKLFKSHRKNFKHGEQMRDFIYVKDCVNIMYWLLENRNVNGIFNLGTGKARSWNDLINAVFSAMNLEPAIDYIDMPASIKDRYQYFTEAEMDKIEKHGCPVKFHSLEDAVKDYVSNYLMKDYQRL